MQLLIFLYRQNKAHWSILRLPDEHPDSHLLLRHLTHLVFYHQLHVTFNLRKEKQMKILQTLVFVLTFSIMLAVVAVMATSS
jgi:hypothetical protein